MLQPRRMEVMGNRANELDGMGRLGQSLLDYDHDILGLEVVGVDLPQNAQVLVYCRKTNGTLTEAIEYCSDTETPLLFLSSGIPVDTLAERNFPVVKVPNAALGVIDYLQRVETAARTDYSGWQATIIEHHQEAKADTSGTAKKLADMLGIGYENIISVRNFKQSQEEYGIPDSSRDGYAVHSVVFTNPATGETSDAFEVVVRGREVYAAGVMDIYRALQENPEAFTNGTHDIVDLVKRGIVRATEL